MYPIHQVHYYGHVLLLARILNMIVGMSKVVLTHFGRFSEATESGYVVFLYS